MKPLYIKKNGTVHKVAGVGMPSVYPAGNVSYDNTTSGLTAEDTQSAIDELADSVADKADKDGSYSTLTAGQILVNNNLLTTDTTPFLTRQTLNPTGFSGYVREKLVGASYAWNQQLVAASNWVAYNSSNVSVSVNSGVLTATLLSETSGSYQYGVKGNVNYSILPNHVYLYTYEVNPSVTTTFMNEIASNGMVDGECPANTWTRAIRLVTRTSAITKYGLIYPSSSMALGSTYKLRNMQLIDLTLAFGSTIADYLYGLSNNGGITKLRDMGCPIDKYTPYGYGLYSVKTSGKLIRGFNQWDEEWEQGGIEIANGNNITSTDRVRSKDYIPVIPNTTYYFRIGFVPSSGNMINDMIFYGKDKSYIGYVNPRPSNSYTFTTPSNCYYVRLMTNPQYGGTYRNDICINISDTNKNGQYEPYSSTTYPLGNDELRGLFKLVNNEIVADGDVKESNGIKHVNWDEVDLGSLTWEPAETQGVFGASITGKKQYQNTRTQPLVCAYYTCISDGRTFSETPNKSIYNGSGSKINYVFVYDTAYSDAATFKTAMNGVKLTFEKATPTTEQSTPFADPMSMVGATIEEYIDNREIPCPVGHETGYYGIGTEGFSMPPAPEKMDNIYKLYYSKNGYGFIPDDFKSKTFSYEYTGATVADTQYNVQNAKANVFGLESKDTIIGMSIYMSMGDTACNFSTPVYNKNSDMFIFKPTDSNATYLTFDGVVFYR